MWRTYVSICPSLGNLGWHPQHHWMRLQVLPSTQKVILTMPANKHWSQEKSFTHAVHCAECQQCSVKVEAQSHIQLDLNASLYTLYTHTLYSIWWMHNTNLYNNLGHQCATVFSGKLSCWDTDRRKQILLQEVCILKITWCKNIHNKCITVFLAV